jgi:hypothetical protein
LRVTVVEASWMPSPDFSPDANHQRQRARQVVKHMQAHTTDEVPRAAFGEQTVEALVEYAENAERDCGG